MLERNAAVAIAILVACSLAAAQAPNIAPFSADMKMSQPGGENATGKMYWGSGKIRIDMDSQGQKVSMINDVPKKTTYMIMHQQRMYMEMSSAGNPMGGGQGMHATDIKPYDPNNPCANREGYTCKKVGTETVNGRSCDKWEFAGPNSKETVWIDQTLHFPIRTVSAGGSTLNLTNVKEGSQAASLFEVPAGYTKMNMGNMKGGKPKPQ
ncbi:MAG: DUF4412 domain-containing protein [Terriglobales bacterium]